MEGIRQAIVEAIGLHHNIVGSDNILHTIKNICQDVVLAFKNGNKLLLCGNGGSAADAQHIAAEFSGKFLFDREPLDAEALHVNTSYLTAVANDYSFDEVFARLVIAKGKPGDMLIGISTSGNSKNVIHAMKVAQKREMITIGLTGQNGSSMTSFCTHLVKVPSNSTPRIQEAHIMIGHIICEMVERELFMNEDV
jgi:D-sedoheptulose 7-phosphate isomerase